MKKKRILTKALAMTLSLSLICGIAFAADWDLAKGNIIIDTSSGIQRVTQGENNQEDSAPVIVQSVPAAGNSVTITGGGTANVTIRNVDTTTDSGSGIDVQGKTEANIQVEGSNSVATLDTDHAAIHVSEGKLNLNVTEGSSLNAQNNSSDGYGAAIGSDRREDLSGSIAISGKGSVTADSKGGAGIGSGSAGNVTGSITTGEGDVTASGNYGAGIGSGSEGNVTGSISTGDGNVTAGSAWGAGIGSGSAGDITTSGSISTGKGNVTVTSEDGAGIGSGFNGHMNGSISTGEGQVGTRSVSGAGIGSGSAGNMGGSISTGDGSIRSDSSYGAGIGSGVSGDVTDTGSITTGMGTVTSGSCSGAGIGSGYGGKMNGKVNVPAGGQVIPRSMAADQIGSGVEGSVGEQAQLNVQAGSNISGTEIENLEDAYGLGIPDEQVHFLNPVQEPVENHPSSALSHEALYWVLSEGAPLKAREVLEGSVLTLTAEAENAELHVTGYGLTRLQAEGIRTIVFKTASLESSFELAAVAGSGDLVLSHKGTRAELTLGGKASDLLK